MLAKLSNSVSTFGMLLILTYQLQTVMGYSPLRTGLLPLVVLTPATNTTAMSTAATVHRYTAAAAWGAAILLVATAPAVLLINAKAK